MVPKTVALFGFVLVILLSIILFMMSPENLPPSIRYRWKAMSEIKGIRGGNYETEGLRQNEGNLLTSWLNATQSSRTAETSTRDSEPETDKKNMSEEYPIPIIHKRFFKQLPKWNFEDIYNLDAPPRPNTCSQSLRNSRDEDFQKAFLPNIRMFLHKDNINMREWNRLSHFNNPFGFMDMKYEANAFELVASNR